MTGRDGTAADPARLDGRHIMVIGAGPGIGEHAARAVAAAGARVSCLNVVGALAEHVAGQVDGYPVVADATDEASLDAGLRAAVGAYGELAGVIDIVGGPANQALADVDAAGWDDAFALNVRHALCTLQTAPRYLNPVGASLVFVGSIAGLTGAPTRPAYGAAKAALLSLVRSAAVALAPGVRVNAVSPALVWTPRVAQLRAGHRAAVGAVHPLRRVGTPQDVAGALLFMVSDLSSWVTGQNLVVDGGLSCLDPYDGRLP